MNILVIDIGGTNVKVRRSGVEEVRKHPSGPQLTPALMVEAVKHLTNDLDFEVVSIGYPGPVVNNKILKEPHNLAPGWMNFDFEAAFGKPVKVINDAAMQALGSYEGGRMLFLGLGTGLGNTLILDGTVAPLELGHLPYKKKKSFEDYVGVGGLNRLGKKKWREAVEEVVGLLRAAVVADYVVLGGGNVKKLDQMPPGCRAGDNLNAFKGGERLWEGVKLSKD